MRDEPEVDDDLAAYAALDEILPSLTQQVRARQLNVARGILFVLGALIATTGVSLLAFSAEIGRSEANKGHHAGPGQRQAAAEEEGRVTRAVRVVGAILAFVALAYFVLGSVIASFPVPVTILALTTFVAGNAVILVVTGGVLLLVVYYWAFLVGIAAALAKTIQSAVAFERERGRSAPRGGADDFGEGDA
jgi:hypothetical protein